MAVTSPEIPPIPPFLQTFVDRLFISGLVPHHLDQITINEYLPGRFFLSSPSMITSILFAFLIQPSNLLHVYLTNYRSLYFYLFFYQSKGQGISPHIDTSICFAEGVVTLSLSSNCVMEFFHPQQQQNQLAQQEGDIEEEQKEKREDEVRKLIFLERRSLLVLSGDARYYWKHGIAYRKVHSILSHPHVIFTHSLTHSIYLSINSYLSFFVWSKHQTDIVNGIASKRDRRLAITFRKVVPTTTTSTNKLS